MRIGEDLILHNRIIGIKPKIPQALTITTVTYVPNNIGYYTHSLDVIKECLSAIHRNTSHPFDLLVFDNGSNPETVNYLTALYREGLITCLCLSAANMFKMGAWNYLFSMAQGDLVYYFDSDIYHYEGWFDECKKIFDSFEKAGMVCGNPDNPSDLRRFSSTIAIADSDTDIIKENGIFVSDEYLIERAISLGKNPEEYIKKRKNHPQIKLVKNNTPALISATHAQFLIKKEVLNKIFPQPRDWAVNNNEKDFDDKVDSLGYMRLACTKPVTCHLGNILPDNWDKKTGTQSMLSNDKTGRNIKPRLINRLIKIKVINHVILKIYATLFKIIYSKPSASDDNIHKPNKLL
jgi:glycosyltransferase involved in cell wall biosynthesis